MGGPAFFLPERRARQRVWAEPPADAEERCCFALANQLALRPSPETMPLPAVALVSIMPLLLPEEGKAMTVFSIPMPIHEPRWANGLGLALCSCLCLAVFVAGPSVNAAESRQKTQPDKAASSAPATTAAGQVADLPATSLDLVLMGIVDGGSRDRRAVILSKKDRVQQLYQVGDLVAGAQVVRILWGKVVLRNAAGDEVLDMRQAADYRVTERAAPVVAAAAGPSAVSPPARDITSTDSWEADDRFIPERIRLVLPGQESVAVEEGQGGAEPGQ